MKYNFTDRVRKALALGREEAIRLGHDQLGSEHILLGLLREGRGVSVAVLEHLGADVVQIRERVEAALPSGGASMAVGEMAYSASGKKTLELAMAESREMGHMHVGTEHMLLGVLGVTDGAAAEVLNGMSVTVEGVRTSIRDLLGATKPTDLAIDIDDESNVPIVEQIVARVKEAVVRGMLSPGTEMPEVHRLADRLDISPSTVARAYAELERARVLVPGGGPAPVVAGPGKPERDDPEVLIGLLRPAVAVAHQMGISADDLRSALERAMAGIYADPS